MTNAFLQRSPTLKMFIRTLLSFALLASTVAAQTYITAPAPGSTVNPGEDVTVQVTVVDAIINFDEISIAIGLQSCPDGSCNPTSGYLGTVLYQGPFTPQPSGVGVNLYENFTVTIPSSTPSGQAVLGVANFFLQGQGYGPNLNIVNETLNVA